MTSGSVCDTGLRAVIGRRGSRARPSPKRTRLTPLIALYLEKRDALVRFFAARLGSTAAAEDVVQDIYLKLSGLDPDAAIHNEAAFIYRLGSNLMLDRLRHERRAARRDGDWRDANTVRVAGDDVVDEPPADEAVAGRERLARMLQALEALPLQQRQAFRMHKLEAMSQAETAAALGVSVSSVEKYVRAALRSLAEQLG